MYQIVLKKDSILCILDILSFNRFLSILSSCRWGFVSASSHHIVIGNGSTSLFHRSLEWAETEWHRYLEHPLWITRYRPTCIVAISRYVFRLLVFLRKWVHCKQLNCQSIIFKERTLQTKRIVIIRTIIRVQVPQTSPIATSVHAEPQFPRQLLRHLQKCIIRPSAIAYL